MARTFEALKHRNYRLWFSGQIVSLMGTWMQSTAQGFLVFQLTRSPAWLGYVALASGVPPWLFMMYGGAVSDRMSKRRLLVVTQIMMMLCAVALAALTATGLVRPWHIIVLSACLGIANAFDAPARQAFVVDLVPKKDVGNAIALNSAMFNTGAAVGPAIAGIVYAAMGPAWCFGINAASFLAIIAGLSAMRFERREAVMPQGSILQGIWAGFKYVHGHREIRTILGNIVAISIFGSAFITLIPAWAVDVLHGDAVTAGLLQSGRGVGSVIASITLATVGHATFSMTTLRRGSLVLPVCLFVFALIHWLPASLVSIAVAGAALMVCMNLSNVFIQDRVSDQMRGRVMGIYNLGIFGLLPVGSMFSGLAAEHFGAPATLIGSAILLALVSSFMLYGAGSRAARTAGFSLLEVMVAIGLLGILVLVIAEVFSQQISVQNKVRDRGALEDMRNVVRSVVKCDLPCATNVARIPANQGRWSLAATCDDTGLKVQVTDSRGKVPVHTSNLFAVNNGYVCMYLPDPTDEAALPDVSVMPGVVPE